MIYAISCLFQNIYICFEKQVRLFFSYNIVYKLNAQLQHRLRFSLRNMYVKETPPIFLEWHVQNFLKYFYGNSWLFLVLPI